MNLLKRPATAIVLLLVVLTVNAAAQQKRQTTPKPQPKPAVAPTPAPTFDTLIPADSYTLYGEVRGAGQLIRSNTINEVLEPVLKLAGPPKEFKSILKWLNAHAEQLMSSRLLVAAWPVKWPMNETPDTIIAVEFGSPEEAAKFATPLNEFLPTVVPNVTVEAGPESKQEPNFHVQRFGSLVVLTQRPWTMKQLKPAGSKLLSEDVNFRTARNRFTSEPIFVYFDIKLMERQDEESRKRAEEEYKKQQDQLKREATEADEKEEKESENAANRFESTEQVIELASPEGTAKEAPTPDPIWNSFSMLGASFFSGETKSPEAIGLGLSFEGDSFDLRALLLNKPGENASVIPFMPMLITGNSFSPEAANIFPADTEMLATMSLDLPAIYTAMSKPPPKQEFVAGRRKMVMVNEDKFEPPFAAIEQRLKINLKDDLLPLLGSEVAVRLPVTNMGLMGGFPVMLTPQSDVKGEPSKNGALVLAVAVRDKEGLRALMPKLIDNLGFKGASSFAQTERREDTETVSFANFFSYAFIGNFLVLSSDPATIRSVVDSYLKHETLGSEMNFRNATRWQPRPSQGQIYIGPSLMESFKVFAQQSMTRVPDQLRASLIRASENPQPITYSLSNEGLGPLHEVHIPTNLVLIAVAGVSGEANPPPLLQNERMAMGMVYMIANAEQQYRQKQGNGVFATLEQLIAEDIVSKETLERSAYRFEVTVSGDKFEISAVPKEYGKSGNLSLFMDQTHVLRGGDKNGASATATDPPI